MSFQFVYRLILRTIFIFESYDFEIFLILASYKAQKKMIIKKFERVLNVVENYLFITDCFIFFTCIGVAVKKF